MNWEEIHAQLTRYSDQPHNMLLPTPSLLADLNDDLMHLRHRDHVREDIEQVKAALDALAGVYNA